MEGGKCSEDTEKPTTTTTSPLQVSESPGNITTTSSLPNPTDKVEDLDRVGSTTREASNEIEGEVLAKETGLGGSETDSAKRPRELLPTADCNDATGSDDVPKPKKARKEGDEGQIPPEDPSHSNDTESTLETENGSKPMVTNGLKVPPIKIVLQSHSGGETDPNTTAQTSTSATGGFPYIVNPSEESSTTAGGREKGKDDDCSKIKEDSEIGKGSSSPTPAEAMEINTISTASDEKGMTKDTPMTSTDGSQSPSVGKEKHIRVTRSSQRNTTLPTTNSSPGASPKTTRRSPSPNPVDMGSPQPPISISQEIRTESPVPAGKPKEDSELHPRKRKLKAKDKDKEKKDEKETGNGNNTASSSSSSTSGEAGTNETLPSHLQPSASFDSLNPVLNCYEMYLNIRKQIERRRRSLFPVQPKPPQGFKDYLMNRGTYVLSSTPNVHLAVPSNPVPSSLPSPLKELFLEQEKERHRLRLQQVVEKEKLVLSVEQEILRVHGRAARALSNQALPFSVCTLLRDEEVYNLLTPEQEEKDRNVRSRYNGRLFLSWLQDVDDKWEKIKESMVLRHHNEAESLFAVQKMDWEWKMKEIGLCDPKATPLIDEFSVPMVFVSDDFDLLPA